MEKYNKSAIVTPSVYLAAIINTLHLPRNSILSQQNNVMGLCCVKCQLSTIVESIYHTNRIQITSNVTCYGIVLSD